jgi:hypothetical protein
MHPLTILAQSIVEEEFGLGHLKEGWKRGYEHIITPTGSLLIQWTTIECSQCSSQVYFNTLYRRHQCSECGYGF